MTFQNAQHNTQWLLEVATPEGTGFARKITQMGVTSDKGLL
jgi:hypothetical protein